jgi:hypothetical protein
MATEVLDGDEQSCLNNRLHQYRSTFAYSVIVETVTAMASGDKTIQVPTKRRVQVRTLRTGVASFMTAESSRRGNRSAAILLCCRQMHPVFDDSALTPQRAQGPEDARTNAHASFMTAEYSMATTEVSLY